MTEELTVHALSVCYGNFEAVRSVSFDLHAGEILALLGSSGSGKSTLLRAISGLEPVASGDIRWGGTSVVSRPVHLRGFGLMFQDGQLFPHRDVRGNVAYGLNALPREERDARVRDVLSLVGMSDYASRPVTSLSGGQAQRIALARALAPSPGLILLDEPLSALDRGLRERLSVDIREVLKTSGTAAIYVTHDQDEAFAVADRIAVMIDGQIARIDTPLALWNDPQRRDVAEFLGYAPFLRDEATGQLRALPPGALTCVPLHKRGAVPARVDGEVRAGRGRVSVSVQVDGQRARARVNDVRMPAPPALNEAAAHDGDENAQNIRVQTVGTTDAEAILEKNPLACSAQLDGDKRPDTGASIRVGDTVGVTYDRSICPVVTDEDTP